MRLQQREDHDLLLSLYEQGRQILSVRVDKFGPVDGNKKVAKDDTGLLQQPASPKYRTALVEIYVRGQDFGGSDKSANGHRYDSIPFANGAG